MGRPVDVLARCAALAPFALVAGCSGCADPTATFEAVARALERADVTAAAARVHPDYSDPLGDRARLLGDLEGLAREVIALRASDVEVVRGPAGPTLIGKLEVHLAGPPEWTMVGPLRVELAAEGRALGVRSGLLDDLRDVRALFAARRAALEANDADALAELIHPEYRDGALDRDGAVARLRADLAGVPVRIEPRSYWAEVRGLDTHVDERYQLRVGEAEHMAIARLTLRRAAGRWKIFAGLYPPQAE